MKTKEKVNPKTPVRFSNGGDVADKNNLRQLQIFRFNLLSRGIKEGSPQYEEQMQEFVKNNPSQTANVAKSTEVFNQTQKEVAAQAKREAELAEAEKTFIKDRNEIYNKTQPKASVEGYLSQKTYLEELKNKYKDTIGQNPDSKFFKSYSDASNQLENWDKDLKKNTDEITSNLKKWEEERVANLSEGQRYLESPAFDLYKQILAQGTTGKWTGEGFGGPEANAKVMSDLLYGAGITDLKDFGKITSDDGTEFWGNKKTKQPIYQNYSGVGGNVWQGTYTGHGRTNFGVQFAADGTPYFYTQFGGDTSNVGDIVPIVALGLSIFAPGVGTAIGAALGATGTAAAVLGGAIVSGTLAEISGGDFVDGAIKGGISAGLAPAVSSAIGSSVASAMADSAVRNVVTNAITSSATSALTAGLTGGDVGQAAITGALVGAGSAAGQELGISAKYGTDAFSEQTKALLAQERGLGGISQVGGTLGSAVGKIAAGSDAEKTLTSALISTVTQGVTDALRTTVRDSLKNPSAIVAESGEPDFGFKVPEADKLLNIVNGPSTQLASTDNEAALAAIEDLRNEGYDDFAEAPLSVEEMVNDISEDENAGVTVIPGENGTKLVLDKDGNLVDMIPATEPSLELEQVDISKKDTPLLIDKPEQYIVGEPKQIPSPELKRMQDILNEAGGNVTIDANGKLTESTNTEQQIEPEEKEAGEFQGPMGPMTEDKINRYNDEFSRYLDTLTGGETPPPDYGVQDLGITDENFDSFNQNLKQMTDEGRLPSQWQADEEGNYTYVADDGSTLTIGPDGDIVHHTEAPAGNLPGETPAQEPVKQPATQPAAQPAATGPSIDWGQFLRNAAGLGAVAVGANAIGDLLTDDNEQGQTQAQAPRNRLKMDWNQADIQAPVNGIAYGQQYFNPVFTEVSAAEGGLMSLAGGGALGSYSDGGRLLRGPGDGMSDNIPASIAGKRPAKLADGEFVMPADVVSHLGNGSTEAGSKVLYKMMERIRKARTGNPKQGKQINPSKFMPK